MKKINLFIVELVMNTLIHTNGQTTTLEVKKLLRSLGYWALQEDVSVAMREVTLLSECIGTYTVSSNGTYNIFTFAPGSDIDWNYGFAKLSVKSFDEVEEEVEEEVEVEEEEVENVSDRGFAKSLDEVEEVENVSLVDRDPEAIYYFQSQVEDNKYKLDDAKWVVFDKDLTEEIHIYNENLSRDKVRSRYATRLSIPIQDVRSRRVKNFSIA